MNHLCRSTLCLLLVWSLSPASILSFSLTARGENSAEKQFQSLVEEMWEFSMSEHPLYATSVGDHRFNDRLGSVSLADSDRRNVAKQGFLERIDQIEREELSPEIAISYDILRRQTEEDIAEHRFESHLVPITQRSGFHISFPELGRRMPLNTIADFENYITRLNGFGKYAQGYIELMREGVARENVLPEVILLGWEEAVDAQIVEDPEQSLLYEPLKEFPTAVPEQEHERLRAAARQAIAEVVVPAYRTFRKFMAEEYFPRARDTIGASALPEGRDFYRHRTRMYTTLDMSPDEVHQLGLAEVARIRGEMEEIIGQVEFEGEFAEFLDFLRTDPQFYASSTEELMKEVALALKKIDGELPRLFGKLPRMPYGIKEIPDYIAPKSPAAYYQTPRGDGTMAGFFFMNTYDLSSRPLFNIEALSLHEAVPGHHLQLALQQEIEGLPEFRRFSGFTAFIEGWALYAERLGLEVGFYEDPYSDFGRLTMEMWRACRLVVDTGMHYHGWSRQRAIAFLEENTALARHDIRAEVDRYIGWPGQALAYKIGELKIRELRQLAEEKLGENFDVRAFHDMLLAHGSVPLDVLENQVNAWLEEVSGAQ